MDIQVRIVKILDAQRFVSQKNGETYVKNIFIGETLGQYPKKVAFSVMGEERFKAMNIVVGGSYTVSFDVESREWQGKWFTECQAWRAVRMDGQQAAAPAPAANAGTTTGNAPSAPAPTSAPAASPMPETTGDTPADDLPF